MKKILGILALLTAVFLIVGCTGGSGTVKGKAFLGGKDGVKTSFLQGNPPEVVVDNGQSAFNIAIKVENVGEDDILLNDGYVQILGLEPKTFGLASDADFKHTIPEILGARQTSDGSIINGGVATVDFGPLSYKAGIQGTLPQTVWANVCYRYSTFSVTQLCVKKDAQQLLSDKKICELEGEKYPQSSGGPIQITSMREQFAGTGKIGVTMTIEHIGSGDNFFSPILPANCLDLDTNQDRGKIYINFSQVNVGNAVYPVCSGLQGGTTHSGYLRIYKDGSGREKTTLYCTIDTTGTNSQFNAPITAEIQYLYLQHETTELSIRHVS